MELIFCPGLLRWSSKRSPSIFDYTTTLSKTFTYFALQKYHTTPFFFENLLEILQELILSPESSEDTTRFYLQVLALRNSLPWFTIYFCLFITHFLMIVYWGNSLDFLPKILNFILYTKFILRYSPWSSITYSVFYHYLFIILVFSLFIDFPTPMLLVRLPAGHVFPYKITYHVLWNLISKIDCPKLLINLLL